MSGKKIQFRMDSFWKVMLKARLLQFYAATKYPDEEANKYFGKAQGMIEALRSVFGQEFCGDIEKAITVEFALRQDRANSPKEFESGAEIDKRRLADLSVVVIEKAKEYSQSFERVKMVMLREGLEKVAKILGEEMKREKKKPDDTPIGRRGLTIIMPPKDGDDDDIVSE